MTSPGSNPDDFSAESLLRIGQPKKAAQCDAGTMELGDSPPHEMSYLVSKTLQDGWTRPQESENAASPISRLKTAGFHCSFNALRHVVTACFG
jgi:hypothetical protein